MTKIKIYYKQNDKKPRGPEISTVADIETAEKNIQFLLDYNDEVDCCEILPEEKEMESGAP